VPYLPGELNLNGIKWLNLHDGSIVLFLLNVSYMSVKKSFMKKDEHVVDFSLT